MKLLYFLSFCTFVACTTTPPPGVADFVLAAPLGIANMLDSPGKYGNWWRKVPLKNEKKYFEKAFLGPLAPDIDHKEQDFVGWHGIVTSCKNLGSQLELELDHRHVGSNNIRYGTRDSQSIYTVSLEGAGKFKANVSELKTKRQCPENWLPGDLLKIYGVVVSDRKIKTHFIRHWPRIAIELSPTRPTKNNSEAYILEKHMGDKKWVMLEHDFSITNRMMSVDAKVAKSLHKYLNSSDNSIRHSAIYNLGETGGPQDKLLIRKAVQAEKDSSIKRLAEFALKRIDKKSGPWWNTKKPYPYWKETIN